MSNIERDELFSNDEIVVISRAILGIEEDDELFQSLGLEYGKTDFTEICLALGSLGVAEEFYARLEGADIDRDSLCDKIFLFFQDFLEMFS